MTTTKPKKCSEQNCREVAFARGRCGFHYRQFRAEERRSLQHAITKAETNCKRKNCQQCALLRQTRAHIDIDVPERKPFEFVGREQDL